MRSQVARKYTLLKTIQYAVFVLFSLLFACATSDVFVRPGTDFSKYSRVAVLPFQDHPKNPGSGIEVADVLSFALLQAGFDVIDRSQTEVVLREQGVYGQSGMVDPETAPQVGRMLGVQAFITGSVNNYWAGIAKTSDGTYAYSGSRVILTVKMLDVETAQVVWAGTCEGSIPFVTDKTAATKKAIRKAMSNLPLQKGSVVGNTTSASLNSANKADGRIKGQVTTIKKDLGAINIGSSAGVKVGQEFKIMRIIGEGADAITIDVGTAKVLKIIENKSAVRFYPKSGFQIELGDIVVLQN